MDNVASQVFKANSVAASASHQETDPAHLDATGSIYGNNHVDTTLQQECKPVFTPVAHIPDAPGPFPAPATVTPPARPLRYRRKQQRSACLPAAKEHAMIAEQIAAQSYDYGRDRADRFRCRFKGCGKSFSKRYNIKVHTRKHTNETPYHCQVPGCPKKFKWRSSMSHHDISHRRRLGLLANEVISPPAVESVPQASGAAGEADVPAPSASLSHSPSTVVFPPSATAGPVHLLGTVVTQPSPEAADLRASDNEAQHSNHGTVNEAYPQPSMLLGHPLQPGDVHFGSLAVFEPPAVFGKTSVLGNLENCGSQTLAPFSPQVAPESSGFSSANQHRIFEMPLQSHADEFPGGQLLPHRKLI